MKSTSQFSAPIASFRRLRLPLTGFAFLALAVSSLPAAETTIVGQSPRVGDETTLRVLEGQSSQAVMSRDYATLERLWSDQFVVNAPNNRVFTSRAAVFEVFRRSTADLYSSYEKKIECIAFNADLAIIMGVETVVPVGATKSAQRRYTNVWRFANGTWRLIARQASMLAADPQPGPGANPK